MKRCLKEGTTAEEKDGRGPKAHFSCFRASHSPNESEPGLKSTRGKGRDTLAPVQALNTKTSFSLETMQAPGMQRPSSCPQGDHGLMGRNTRVPMSESASTE